MKLLLHWQWWMQKRTRTRGNGKRERIRVGIRKKKINQIELRMKQKNAQIFCQDWHPMLIEAMSMLKHSKMIVSKKSFAFISFNHKLALATKIIYLESWIIWWKFSTMSMRICLAMKATTMFRTSKFRYIFIILLFCYMLHDIVSIHPLCV